MNTHKRKRWSSILLLLLITPTLWGSTSLVANPRYVVSQLTTLDGLSQNDTRVITQDQQGFIWIATNNGLNRYDGYGFKIYRTGDRGLTSNSIRSIAQDRVGNLWIGTGDQGIFKYELDKDRFTSISKQIGQQTEISNLANVVIIDSASNIWATNRNNTLYRLTEHPETGVIKTQTYTLPSTLEIRQLTINPAGQLVILTTQQIYQYNRDTDSFFVCYPTLSNVKQVQWNKEKLYALIAGQLYCYDLKTTHSSTVGQPNTSRFFIAHDQILWSCTPNAVLTEELSAQNPKGGAIEVLRGSYLTTLLTQDSFGNIWMGSYRKGLTRFRKNTKPFRWYDTDRNSVDAMLHDSKERTWFGFVSGSIRIYDNYRQGNQPTKTIALAKTNVAIYTIAEHKKSERIYIGTSSGLYWQSSNKNEPFQLIPTESITHIATDSNWLWISTYGSGILLFDATTNKLVRSIDTKNAKLLPSNIIRHITNDNKGNLWVSTSNGLVMITAQSKFTDTPNVVWVTPLNDTDKAMNHKHIQITIQSHDGSFWVGTLDSGIYQLKAHATTGQIAIAQHYTSANNLSNNTIKGVVEDAQGNIWASTSSGLNVIDPKSKTIQNFGRNEGLEEFEFTDLSFVRFKNNELGFGGVNGVNVFNPKHISKNLVTPRIAITSFQVLNKEVYVGDQIEQETITDQVIKDHSQVNLPYNLNSFGFTFASLHYSSNGNNRYSYMLEPYDREWIQTSSSDRTAKYTNIPSGSYTFRIKSSNGDGVWSEPCAVSITIQRPWGQTWWAYGFYAVLLVGLTWLGLRRYSAKQRAANERLAIHRRQQLLETTHKAKMDFFTNVAHEFRTPLTLIRSPLQQLMQQDRYHNSPDEQRMLQTIDHNSNILLRLSNQVLNLSKHDENRLKLHIVQSDFILFAQRVIALFDYVVKDKNVDLRLTCDTTTLPYCFDPEQMESIFFNLISNALKHTPKGGSISCDITHNTQTIELSVTDTGSGVDEQTRQYIFDRFYSTDSHDSEQTGIGVGLALTKSLVEMHGGTIGCRSQVGFGSTFWIKLPIPFLLSDPMPLLASPTSTEAMDQEDILFQRDETGDMQDTILIVDDNQGIVDLLVDLLSAHYHTITASNGQKGYLLCEQELPTLVLADVMMPIMNGVELCLAIKNSHITSHIPVVMLTAKVSHQGQKEGLSAHADAYCTKPFDNEILLLTIATTIANRKKMAKKFKEDFIYESADNKIATLQNEFLNQLVALIHENMANEELDVEFIAQKMRLTSIALNKKLKQMTTLTANMFIRNVRLKQAAHMLATGQYTVQEVTYTVGFNDLRYFRDCFKKEYGTLPSDWGKK